MAGKGPLIESIPGNDRDLLVTFLWRETYETHNVLAGWPMAAWRADDYYMSRLGNTNVWYKTIQVERGSRFSYWLSPNLRAGADRVFTDQLDPLNPRVFPEEANSMGNDLSSVLETPGAPDESFALRIPVRRGTVEHKTVRLVGNDSEMWVYTPPGYAATEGQYPFVLLFDGGTYTRPDYNNALPTLDNLINDGRMRPAVVCFVDSLFRRLSSGDLNGVYNEAVMTYGDAIVLELLPQLRSAYAITTSGRDTVIGGFSAGGLAASLFALRHSDVFGNVLAQSGAFRLRKRGSAEPTSVAQLYVDAPRLPVRFYLETGLYENVPSAGLPLHDLALDEGITTSNRHFRDVLIAKGYDVTYRETPGAHESVHWRATLADALMSLLNPVR
jgi:enterochelin esterase family protein